MLPAVDKPQDGGGQRQRRQYEPYQAQAVSERGSSLGNQSWSQGRQADRYVDLKDGPPTQTEQVELH